MEAKCTVKYAFNKMTAEFLHGVAKTLLDFLAGSQSRLINLTPIEGTTHYGNGQNPTFS